MIQKTPFLLYVLLVGILTGCTPYYIANQFETRTSDHRVIAVLPLEMVYSGKIPDDLTSEDVDKLGIAESKAFQISFHNEILRSTRSGRKPIRVDLLPYEKTWSTLEEAGIGIRESWRKDPAELAELLKVDAVVQGRIEKYRLMSDLQSFGIDVGAHILRTISDNSIWPWLPPHITRSKEIRAGYSLVDREDGTVLWSIARDINADWSRPSNDIIDDISRQSARRFPYRAN